MVFPYYRFACMQSIFVQLGLGGIIQATCTSHKRACKNDMAQNRIVLVTQ